MIELANDKGVIGAKVKQAIEATKGMGVSPSVAIGRYLGLDPQKFKSQPKIKREKISKLQSYGESALLGLANMGDGFVQGAEYLGDKMYGAINDTFGTNFATDDYETHNKKYKHMEDQIKQGQVNSGRGDGTDWVAGITETMATIPTFLIGGGAGMGAKGLLTYAGTQGAIGAGVGMAKHADNAKQRTGNMIGGGIGGAVGGVVGEKVLAPVVGKIASAGGRLFGGGRKIEASKKIVDDAIKAVGKDTDLAISKEAQRQLVKAVEKSGGKLDAEALVRKQLLDRYGIKGTQAQITRNPKLWTAEKEAAKHNSDLNNVHIENHKQLDELMQKLIKDTGAKNINTHEKMASKFSTLKQVDKTAKENISKLYDNAKNMTGNNVQLNHLRFINNATKELEENMLGSFVKGDTMSALKGMFKDPNFKLDYGKSEELIKIINKKLRSTSDGNERYALGIIRKNLEKEVGATADDLAGSLSVKGADDSVLSTQKAWDDARNAYRQHAEAVDTTPALKGAIDDAAPDKAFNKYVLNANAGDIIKMTNQLKKTPQGRQNIKDMQGAMIEHFLAQATKSNGGGFSPSGLARAIDSFGENRMKALFSKEQISRINDIRKVADILLQQPLGSHVNHSNTGSVIMRQLLGVINASGKMPVIGNTVLGMAGAVGNVTKAGAGAKMMNGAVPKNPNPNFGLSPELLKKIGLAVDGTRATSTAIGAGVGSQ